jgi:hypothetical protein
MAIFAAALWQKPTFDPLLRRKADELQYGQQALKQLQGSPQIQGKVVLLVRFDSKGSLEIADPYCGANEDFLSCFQQMSRCCDNLAARLGVNNNKPAHSQILPADPKNL